MNVLQSTEPEILDFHTTMNLLNEYHILTGSRAFNVHSECSDYDYIITDKDLENITNKCFNFKHFELHEGFSSETHLLGNTSNIKVITKEDICVNFISYAEEETVKLFKLVNERMLDEVSPRDLRCKESRYNHFELITKQLGIHNNILIHLDIEDIQL